LKVIQTIAFHLKNKLQNIA